MEDYRSDSTWTFQITEPFEKSIYVENLPVGQSHTMQRHLHILFPPIENGKNQHCFKSNARRPIQV